MRFPLRPIRQRKVQRQHPELKTPKAQDRPNPAPKKRTMEFPARAWIQNSELAETIEQNNATQRVYLREQLIPFIKQIHERNLCNPDELIPLSDFLGNAVGHQLDYKIARYKKDIAHPETQFSVPKLAERPDYMKFVDQEFIAKLPPAERSILRDSFHNLYDTVWRPIASPQRGRIEYLAGGRARLAGAGHG